MAMRILGALVGAFALLDAHGQIEDQLQWQLCLGGVSGDFVQSVTPLSDQGCLVVGNSWSTFGTQVPAGDRDMWLTRLDASGTVLWQRLLGGPSPDYAEQVAALPNGDFLLCGSTKSTSGTFGPLPGAILAKISSNGDLIWSHRYGGTSTDGEASEFKGSV